MHFELTDPELARFREWKKKLPELQEDIFGKDFMFEFVFYPTGLGVVKKIRRVDGEVLDLTDYSNW